jgi:exopolyphosphatase
VTIHAINRYLLKAKTDLNCRSIDYIIIGNQASDLDSMASAIVYAYLLAVRKKDKIIVPVMPIPRSDFKLRTEAVYVFDKARIELNNLVFLDEVDLDRVMNQVGGLVLVDHNKLSGFWDRFREKVSVILDHHKDEHLYPHAVKKVIEKVGSTATLVGEELVTLDPKLIDEPLALLLWGTILLDTVNLDPAAGRVTPKDEKIAQILMMHCPLEQEIYFKGIQDAKFDTADLNTFDLLRRDYKAFKMGRINCGISSVLLPLILWGKTDRKLSLEFESYVKRQNLDLLFTMNAYMGKAFNRDLAIYCKDADLHGKLVAYLQEKGLGLIPVRLKDQKPCLEGTISFYSQGNIGISRKKLSPLLDAYFTSS